MRIPSGSSDRYIYFVAVDVDDLKTRETGFSSFTVYRSRNNGAATAYTTPTIAELDAVNMPGVYALLVDEDTTIGATHDTEEYCVHFTHAGMAPVTRTAELYRPEVEEGKTLDVGADSKGLISSDVGLNNLSAAEVNAEVDSALADYDAPTKTELDSGLAGLNDLSAAEVNAEADSALADYDAPTKAELDSGLAGLNDLSAAEVNAEVDSAFGDYDGPTKAEFDAAISALNDLSAAEVNAQLLDVLRIDTVAELAAVPAKNAPLHQMIQLCFLWVRNKVLTTESTHTLRNDADDADIGSCAISDVAGVFTKGKIS